MADRVFCIDFGSAYTKVALRRDPSADSELLAGRGGTTSEANFCIPSTVAVDRRGPKPVPEFGERVASWQTGGGIDVYRNWKKSIFVSPSPTTKSLQSPLEALLQSEELRDLATKYGVASGQINHLQQLVGAAKHLVVGPGGRVISSDIQQQTIAASLAPHFFIWLRQQVLEACSRLPTAGLKYDSIPARITIPEFAQGTSNEVHPAWKIIVDALSKAGWPLHPDNPTVAEPYANVIGILTKAANILHRGKVRIGDMFGKGPLITVLKDTTHHPAYRAFVVDVGAFTTDFAVLTLVPDGKNSSDPDANISIKQDSIPLGISDLDAHVIHALPKEKGEWLRKASPMDWEDFRPAVYTEGKGIRKPELGIIGGTADAEIVRSCLETFTSQLARETTKFLESLSVIPSGSLEELILTGGGSFIPFVRDAIQSSAQVGGHSYVKTHAPALKRTSGGPPIDKLDTSFTRGGSALGGASVYFEKSLY
jgi:hypothetical protein